MCGIAGIIAQASLVSELEISRITDAIMHRGPDGSGCWISDDKSVGLGHRRLSIIDLSNAGHQPMHFMDRFTITFNGEIYNYIEIRNQLHALGYQFKSQSDTEVILAAYHAYGEQCLSMFDGMFAFAIWDKLEGELFLARDRFGEKPLFYTWFQNKFIFASEIKGLCAVGVPRTINARMLYNYYYFKSLFNPEDLSETFYSNIRQLKPAHFMRITASGIKKCETCYWSIADTPDPVSITDEEAIEKFSFLFKASVQRRLRSDVPVGSSLSGGLDSSAVVSMINQIKGKEVQQKTFSAIFPGYKKDESKYVDCLLQSVNAEQFTCIPNSDSIANNIEKIIKHLDEPFNSLSIAAQYEVMQLARRNGVTVLLDGQGADEYLCGYPGLIDSYLLDLKENNPAAYAKELETFQSVHAGNTVNSIKRRLVRMRIKQVLGSKIIDQLLLNKQKFSHPSGSNLINSIVGKADRVFYNRVYLHKNLHGMLHYSTFNGGLQELLRYADRNSMAHSLEVRLPYLSHELVEFVFSLPDHFKFRLGYTKYILRKSMHSHLPEEICWRKEKIGFEVPDNSLDGQNLPEYLIKAFTQK